MSTDDSDNDGIVPSAGQMDPEETTDAKVLDPNDWIQKRRLRDINDARQAVTEARTELQHRMMLDSRVNEDAAARAYRTQLENYISEVLPLFTEHDYSNAAELWEDKELGSFTVDPPPDIATKGNKGIFADVDKVLTPAQPETYNVIGIKDVIAAPKWIVAEFTAKVYVNGEEQWVTKERKRQIPWDVLDRVFHSINQFVEDKGLGLDPEDKGRDRYDLTADDV